MLSCSSTLVKLSTKLSNKLKALEIEGTVLRWMGRDACDLLTQELPGVDCLAPNLCES